VVYYINIKLYNQKISRLVDFHQTFCRLDQSQNSQFTLNSARKTKILKIFCIVQIHILVFMVIIFNNQPLKKVLSFK